MPCYYSGVKKYQAQNALEYQASVTPAFAEQRCSTPAPVPPRRAPSHSRGSRSRKLTRWLFPPEPPAVAHTQAGAPDPGCRREARRGRAAAGRKGGAAGPALRAAPWRLPPAEPSPRGRRQCWGAAAARHVPAACPRAGLASGDTRATAAAWGGRTAPGRLPRPRDLAPRGQDGGAQSCQRAVGRRWVRAAAGQEETQPRSLGGGRAAAERAPPARAPEGCGTGGPAEVGTPSRSPGAPRRGAWRCVRGQPSAGSGCAPSNAAALCGSALGAHRLQERFPLGFIWSS